MTFTEVKRELGYTKLNLNLANDLKGKVTEWFRHWDDDNRVAVSIHQDLVAEIQERKEKETLEELTTFSIQIEDREGKLGPYVGKRIVLHTPPEVVL